MACRRPQRCDVLGSAGLSVLLEAAQLAEQLGIGFSVAATSRTVRWPIEVTGLQRRLHLVGDVVEVLVNG
jgi:anti-anti-sigma factor